MSLQARLDQDLKTAMAAKDADKLSTVRFLKSAVKYAAIEKKAQNLSDAEIRQVIQKQVKQHRESIDQFTKAGRTDLLEKEKRELAILESYLPKQLGEEELMRIVESEVRKAGASSKKDFGRMMKILNEKLAGGAEPRRVSESLNKLLP